MPVLSDRKRTPALRWFAEDRRRDTAGLGPKPSDTVGLTGLQTASCKAEFTASSLKRFYAGGVVDEERPAMGPQYLPSWKGYSPNTAGCINVLTPQRFVAPMFNRRGAQLLPDRGGEVGDGGQTLTWHTTLD